jgi:hypothetical protein
MPLPASGEIDFDDLNLELGNVLGTQLDMESAALEFNLTRPHGMDEFYGLSLIPSASSISVNPTSLSFSNLGAAATINVTSDGRFDIIESLTWISLSKTTGADNDSFIVTADAQPFSSAGEPSRSGTIVVASNNATNINIPVSQLARYPFIGLAVQTPGSTAGSYAIQITADAGVQWTLSKDGASFYVSSFTPTSGIGPANGSYSITTNGTSQRSVTFTLVATNIVLPNEVVTVYQPSSGPPAYTFATWNGSVSVNGQNGNVSYVLGNATFVSITSTNPYPTISTAQDRIISITLGVPSGYSNSGTVSGTKTVEQAAYITPTYTFATWNGSVSVNGGTGAVEYVLSNATFVSITSTNPYPTVQSTTQRIISITLGVPAGYTNSGGTVSGTKTVNQPVAPRILTLTPNGSNTFAGNQTSFNLFVDDLYYTDTSWTVTEGINSTLVGVGISPSSGNGDAFVVITFQSNSVSQRSGTFTLNGGESSISVTLIQNVYVPPATISISSVSPASPYDYYGQGGIQVNVSRTNSTSYNAFIDPTIQSTGAYFQSNQAGYTSPDQLSNLTSNTFFLDIPARSDGTIDTYESIVRVSVTGDSDTYTLQQTGLVTWNVNPTSLSFTSAQQSLSVTLNTNLSWTAQISGVGFSIGVGDFNGSGNATFSILATTNSGSLRTGIFSLSSTGQTTIQVSLTQAAAGPAATCTPFVTGPASNLSGVCQAIGNNTRYHDGAGSYPVLGDITYSDSGCTIALAAAYYYMDNGDYIRVIGGGEVIDVAPCGGGL